MQSFKFAEILSILLPLLFQHLEAVIRARIPSIIALINKTIDELEAELDRLGRPIGGDAGVISRACSSFSLFFFYFLYVTLYFLSLISYRHSFTQY